MMFPRRIRLNLIGREAPVAHECPPPELSLDELAEQMIAAFDAISRELRRIAAGDPQPQGQS